MEVRVQVRLTEVDGRKLTFVVEADDGMQVVSRGTHQRFVIDAERFNERMRHKAASAR
jgi:fluoroacetyl-CoA thioesterase